MGVQSLAFNEDHILLFSAGFDHDIYVWNPYIGDKNTKSSEDAEKSKNIFLDKVQSSQSDKQLKLNRNQSAMML